jgi:hypothetical protein
MKNVFLYLILWAGGAIVAGLVIIMWNTPGTEDEIRLFGENTAVLHGSNASGNIVNELLLSAQDLNISGTNNLITFNYKDNGPSLNEQIRNDPEKLYRNIFNRKLEKLGNRSPESDFYIRQVPK